MPENFALQLARDAHGFLWAGTRQGLVRMNGDKVEQVRVPAGSGDIPPFPFINALRFDERNRLWVGTRQGIAVLRNGRAVSGPWNADWPKGDPPVAWAGSARGAVAVTNAGKWLEFDETRWTVLPSPSGGGDGNDASGRAVARARDGTVWATESGTLARLENGKWINQELPPGSGKALGLAASLGGGIRVVTGDALLTLKDRQWGAPLPLSGLGDSFQSVSEDPEGGVWIASRGQGLWNVPPGAEKADHFLTGLPKVIDSMYPAGRDAVWLGTRGEGIIQAWRRPFRILDTKVPVYEVRPLPDGRLLVPTLSQGVLVGREGGDFTPWPGTEDELNAFTVAPQRDGSLWTAGQNGLVWHSPDGTRHEIRSEASRCALLQAPDGPMILGDAEGIREFTDGKPTERELPKEVAGRGVYFLTELRGKVYAGGEWGLVMTRDAGKWSILPGTEKLRGHITGITAEEGGRDLWIVAQEDGLVHCAEGKSTVVALEGLKERNVEVMAPVIAAGRIWLGCMRHIVSVTLEEAKAAAAGGRPAAVRVVGGSRVSGMPTMRLVFPHCAAVLPDGSPCFAANEGIVRMDISGGALSVPAPLSAQFRTLTIGSESRTLDPGSVEAILPRGTTALPVRLETSNLQTADPAAFRFQVDDGAWTPAPGGAFVLGDLRPGTHTVRSQATRLGGPWTGPVSSLALNIPLYWWQNTWAVASLLALAGISLPSLMVWGVKVRLRRQRLRLQEATALIESKELALSRVSRFRRLIDASHDIIVVFDPETGVITDANAAAATALAAPGGALHGVRIQDLSPDWPSHAGERQSAGAANFETIFRRHDGKKFPAEVSVRLARDDADQAFGLAIARDITDRHSALARTRSLEHQVSETRKLEAVGHLAEGVAHDFNNLLRIIQGFSQTAQENPEKFQKEVAEAAGRAGQITRQLLAFSQEATTERRELRLAEFLPGALKNIRRALGPSVEIEFTAAPKLPAILADPAQMEQVLLNLSLNSGEAMPGGGNLYVRAETRVWETDDLHMPGWAQPGRWVRLTVRDTGRGMDENTKKRIFDPFFTTKTGGQSTGLGLSVVYGIAQSHGGFLRVTSALGRGTSVEIYFPARLSAAGSAEEEETEDIPSTILLAEDDPSERQLASMILRGAGHEVLPAANGLEALRIFQQHGEIIDLVILDALMPEMTGFGAAERIRETAPDMPILFCSGYSGLEDLSEESIPPGCSVLYKPYSLEKLLRVVSEHLGKTPAS